MVRALSSSVPRRARTAGSRNRRSLPRAPAAMIYIPLLGTGTVSMRRSTIVSGVMRSDSA